MVLQASSLHCPTSLVMSIQSHTHMLKPVLKARLNHLPCLLLSKLELREEISLHLPEINTYFYAIRGKKELYHSDFLCNIKSLAIFQ